jgi:hypothetical protein
MKRLLLFGNSHLSSLRLGWDDVATQHSSYQCIFFGAPAMWSKHAQLEGGTITISSKMLADKVARLSGRKSVTLADYDVIGIVGMFFGFAACVKELRRVHIYGMVPQKPDSQIISRACLRTMFHHILKSSPGFEWANKIKRASHKPVLLIPTPFSSETRLEVDEHIRPVAQHFRKSIPNVFGIYEEVERSVASSAGLIIVEPPPETIAFSGFTKAEFSRGSARLLDQQAKHPAEDYTHMNSSYGAKMLAQIFKAADQLQPESEDGQDRHLQALPIV